MVTMQLMTKVRRREKGVKIATPIKARNDVMPPRKNRADLISMQAVFLFERIEDNRHGVLSPAHFLRFVAPTSVSTVICAYIYKFAHHFSVFPQKPLVQTTSPRK